MKIWYLNCLLRERALYNRLAYLINIIKQQENFCRDCYEERVPLSSDDFVQMMLVDGCFIIELLCKEAFNFVEDDDDAIFKTQRMLSTIKNDLLLVENQLPWTVLDCLFKVTKVDGNHLRLPSLRQLSWLFFQNPTFQYPFDIRTSVILKFQGSHLLENVRDLVVRPYEEVVKDIEYRTPIPSVSELLEIGVKFVVASSNNSQLGITFENGVMEIPPIIIREDGECFIRNLIAYEQCSRKPEQCHMTSYAILLSQLIESVQDVDFLIEKKIITTELSKVSTASFFKRLSNGSEAEFFFYGDLAEEEEMIAIRVETSTCDTKTITDDEIVAKVLGVKSGYIKGCGFGPRPPGSLSKAHVSQHNKELEQIVQSQQEDLDRQCELIKVMEEKQKKFEEFMEKMSSGFT
ncbi:uncharacterized protein LOC110772799 [Prunus avium]|uniref:Uncharacterized protein LOC110772799 n=1 Tax=Prunus avium TaxID=42229 RepID=A0A6P5U1F4_PRUAV|nr:uncharacterized protein LOC110772799 [Prunus avium]